MQQMPKAQSDYYYSFARQNFINFSDGSFASSVFDALSVLLF
jgi:hypothetical protein